jgi:ketosteroid isomerase-like protein
MTATATTRQVLNEFFGRLARFEPRAVANLFAETVDWDVPGDKRVPWTGRRSSREQVEVYFQTLWSECDPAQTDNAVGPILVDGPDAVVLAVFTQTIRATGKRFSTPAAVHITVDDAGLITRFRIYEDSYAVARAYAGEP